MQKSCIYSRNFGVLDGNRRISCGVLYTLIASKIKQQETTVFPYELNNQLGDDL